MSSGKTLSTGTLSLRFMQNANRAKQIAEVQAEKAVVQDEAEWEVAQDVREAWGVDSSLQNAQTVSYETSYLPFLFPPLSDNPKPSTSSEFIRPTGRRTFNKSGMEVVQINSDAAVQSLTLDATPAEDKEKRSKRLASISGSSSSSPWQKDIKKTARMMVHDNSGVGADLRLPSSLRDRSIATQGFLKPSGVDEPKSHNTKATSDFTGNGVISPNSHSEIPAMDSAPRHREKRDRDSDRSDGQRKRIKKKEG